MMPNSTSTRMRRAVIGAVGVAAALAATASLRAPGASAATTTLNTDATWQITAAPAPVTPPVAATIVTTPGAGWTGTLTTGSWISDDATPSNTSSAGAYSFEKSVTLAQPSTLTGSVLAAPTATLQLVGATTITVGTFTSATTPTAVSYATPVPAGTWTVRLTTTIAAPGPGSEGVAATLTFDDTVSPTTSTTAAPEATAYHAFAQPIRVYDSRTGTGSAANGDGPLAFGTTRTISLTQGYLTPSATTKVGAVPAGATSATVTVTIDGTTASGFLTLFAGNASQPASSSINWFGTGQILANMNIVALAADGTIKVTAGGPGSAQLILDVLGYYSPIAPAAPATTTTTTVAP